MAVKGTPPAICQIVGTERHQAPVRAGHMDAAVTQTLQVQVPGILKSHAGNTKSMGALPLQKNLPSSQAGTVLLELLPGFEVGKSNYLKQIHAPGQPLQQPEKVCSSSPGYGE